MSRSQTQGLFGRPSAQYVFARLPLRGEHVFFWCANAPHHSQLGLFHGQRVLVILRLINRSQAASSRSSEPSPPPAAPRTSSSTPTRARKTRRRGLLLAQAARVPPLAISHSSPWAQIVLLGLRDTKSSPAPPGTTRARSPPSRGTRTRARGPPSFSNGGPACRCSTSGPWCPPRTPPPRPLRPPCISCWHYIARRRLPFLSVCRACRGRPLSSAGPGIQPHSSACCSGRISCPKLAQARWRRRRTA